MLSDLFVLFNSVLGGLPGEEWFVGIIASALFFGFGFLIKMIIVRND